MEGILVGCDAAQEWMLPWWWLHYRLHNRHPVTFIDFGMSQAGKKWCQAKGHCIPLDIEQQHVAKNEKVDPLTALLWDSYYLGRDFWPGREAWFKKPLALQKTPYERTIWIDLDCQIRSDLSPLFAACRNPAGLAIVRDRDPEEENRELDYGLTYPDEVTYNGGLIVFEKGSTVIEEFARMSMTCSHEFLGDQSILSRILYLKKLPFTELPRRYNALRESHRSRETAIYHWVCPAGKKLIRSRISLLNPLFFNEALNLC